MTPPTQPPRLEIVILEPWGLGDALIALSSCLSAAHNHNKYYLVTNPKWVNLIHYLVGQVHRDIEVIGLHVPYTEKTKVYNNLFNFQANAKLKNAKYILSIRGDLRDYVVARQIAPLAKAVFVGWLAFVLRRLSFLDWIFQRLGIPVQNRYTVWSQLLSETGDINKKETPLLLSPNRSSQLIVIHLGAQWNSKRYPFFLQVSDQLLRRGFQVEFVAGPGESQGFKSLNVKELVNEALATKFQEARFILCNDSSPMHLAGILKKATLAMVRVSNIKEWLPPGVEFLASPQMPTGYKPDPNYNSEKELDGWPSAEDILAKLERLNWI